MASPGRTEVQASRSAHVAVLAVVAAGALVFWPALRARFYFDDHFHASMLAGRWPTPRSIFDLYNFVGDDDRARLVEHGVLPWWTSPELRVRFFRPLSSALLTADHRIFAGRAFLAHVHSFFWWLATVAVAWRLYVRVLGSRAAALAIAIFALAPCHVVPLAWLANREALVSLAPGLLGLLGLLRFRDEGRLRDAALAATGFAIAFLAGEYALALLGYAVLLAVDPLCGERSIRGWRATALAVVAVPAGAYLAVRAAFRCGARGAGFYADPLHAPLVFLREAPRRFATLLVEGLLGIDGRALEGASTRTRLVVAALVVALVALPTRRALDMISVPRRRELGWLGGGAVLALVPVLAVAPHPRVLGSAVFGLAAVVATALEGAWWPRVEEPRRGLAEWSALAATLLGFAHFVCAPFSAWRMALTFREVTSAFELAAARVANEVSKANDARVFVLRGLGASFYLPFAVEEQFGRPARWSILSQGTHVLALRTGERTLELVAPPDASLIPAGQDQLFRAEDDRFRVGDTVRVPGFEARVVEVSRAGPRRVRFTFDAPLDDPSTAWLAEGVGGVRPVELPEIGFGLPLPR